MIFLNLFETKINAAPHPPGTGKRGTGASWGGTKFVFFFSTFLFVLDFVKKKKLSKKKFKFVLTP